MQENLSVYTVLKLSTIVNHQYLKIIKSKNMETI